MADEAEDEWQLWWDARVKAIEGILGKADDVVAHSPVPFHFGADLGGAADVIFFSKHVPGIVAVTSELIGCDEQKTNQLGNYELMICHRNKNEADWGAKIISMLAQYTVEAVLTPGDTMDIGPATPEGSTIAALLFIPYAQFEVRDRKAGLLLCIGITEDELQACRAGRRAEVEVRLRDNGVYPFTDLFRESLLE